MISERRIVHAKHRSIDWYAWGSMGFLGGAWLWLNHATLRWLSQLPQQTSRVTLLILLGVTLLCIGQWALRREISPLQFRLRRSPLILLFGSAIASIGLRWCLDLESLQAACFALGTYGLMGLGMAPSTWKRGWPFIAAITIGLGVALSPLSRSLIAEIVERLLTPFHTSVITSENILVLDSGIAFIDLPCSGRKSLLTGSLFLIAATVLERRQAGWRWFGIFVANLGLLFSANVLRILTLVVLTYVFQEKAIAELIHVPFGLISFMTVCLISWGLLRLIPQVQTTHKPTVSTNPSSPQALVVTVGCILGLSFIPLPTPAIISPTLLSNLPIQHNIALENISLTPSETKFFASYPGVIAEKKAFKFKEISGSMMFVVSPTWEAHHAPELCLTGSGDRVNHMEKRQLTEKITGRWLSLNDGKRDATYWFQSPTRTTDNYLDRLWSEITRQDTPWTLVSILFDQPIDTETVQPLLNDIHDAIDTRLS